MLAIGQRLKIGNRQLIAIFVKKAREIPLGSPVCWRGQEYCLVRRRRGPLPARQFYRLCFCLQATLRGQVGGNPPAAFDLTGGERGGFLREMYGHGRLSSAVISPRTVILCQLAANAGAATPGTAPIPTLSLPRQLLLECGMSAAVMQTLPCRAGSNKYCGTRAGWSQSVCKPDILLETFWPKPAHCSPAVLEAARQDGRTESEAVGTAMAEVRP